MSDHQKDRTDKTMTESTTSKGVVDQRDDFYTIPADENIRRQRVALEGDNIVHEKLAHDVDAGENYRREKSEYYYLSKPATAEERELLSKQCDEKQCEKDQKS